MRKCASTQVGKYASTCGSVQVLRNRTQVIVQVLVQMCKYLRKYGSAKLHAQVCNCASTQVCKFLHNCASTQVIKYLRKGASTRKYARVHKFVSTCGSTCLFAQVLAHLRSFKCACTQVLVQVCKNASACATA